MTTEQIVKPDPIVNVPVADLLRVTPFKANDDMRYYLNGILVTPYEGHALLVATNGHWLAVYESRETVIDKDRILDLPTWFLRQVERLRDKGTLDEAEPDDEWDEESSEPVILPQMLEVADEKARLTITQATGEALVKPGLPFIDGKFPDWRKVVPDPTTLEPGVISPLAVNYFARLHEAVPHDREYPMHSFQCRDDKGKKNPAVFRFGNLSELIVVLMPRSDDDKLKAWPKWMDKVPT